jgi:hypothetical protein
MQIELHITAIVSGFENSRITSNAQSFFLANYFNAQSEGLNYFVVGLFLI